MSEATPRIAAVMVWVVETGMPNKVARKREHAPEVSALNPPIGLSLVSRMPMVLTIRQPPKAVPIAMQSWQESIIQAVLAFMSESFSLGDSDPVAIKRAKITPMVFWASLAPCA